MDLGLQAARVLVTAASQGLGAATARQFSLEGAKLVINSRNLTALQDTAARINEASGNPVYTHAADITDESAGARLVSSAADILGGLDVLVCNAGGPPAGTFETFDLATWRSAVDIQLLGFVNLIRHALPYLKQSQRPAILAIASISVKQPVENLTLSNAIRPAVIGLTKTLSLELGSFGIRVNAILPASTATERLSGLFASRAAKNNTTPEQEEAKAAAAVPLGRIGTPEEFANVAVFLCSPAGGYINGVALPVDGGALRSTF